MIIVTVLRTHAAATVTEVLTAGRVGMEAKFHFSSEWDGLGKTAVFEAGGVTKDVILGNDPCIVPHECMIAGAELRVGVYGMNADGDIVIPSVYALVGQICVGADPSGDESYPPTPEVGEQAVAMAGAALAAAEEAKAMAEGAVKSVNNVKPDENGNVNVAGGNGGGGNEADGAGKAIVDVTELPTENINEAVLYRLTTGMVVFNGQNGRVFDNTAVYIVDSLPETGEPCSSDIGESTAIYYNTSKGAAYGYVDERASVSLMQPVGWKSASTAFAAMGYQYSGVVTSMNDVARSSAAVLLEHNLYHYKNGWERVAGATPFFDLSNLGLEAVDLAGVADGVSVRVGADTRAIINALARGAVKFGFQIIYNGATLDVEALGSAMYLEAENTYQIHNFSVFADMPMTVTISVDELYVSVSVAAASSGGGAKVYVQPDEPTGAVVGTLWYDTDEPSVSNAEGVSF